MEADSGGSVVKTRRRVRQIKPAANDSNNLENNELQQSKGRRKRVIPKDGGHSETGPVPPAHTSRSVLIQRSLSSARCRIYDWKARRFTKPEQPLAVVPKIDQNVTLKRESKSFSWNLSLEERRKRDSKSVLPTAKNITSSKTSRRRLKRNGRSMLQDTSIDSIENSNQDKGIEDYSSSTTLGPSTSRMPCRLAPEHSEVCNKWKCNTRKRRNDTSGISAAERELHTELVIEEVLRNTLAEGNKKNRIMGQGATTGDDSDMSTGEARALSNSYCVESDNSYNSNKNHENDGKRVKRNDDGSGDGMQLINTMEGCNTEVLHKVTNDGDQLECVVDKSLSLSSSSSSNEMQQNFVDAKRSEREKKNESTRHTMEEFMKDKNFAPVEIIVADAISKDPLGFVHSLRDAKLLKSLEKLAHSRKLNSVVSNEQLEQLRKQRKKEKKREKKEKKKQKRLMKLAASFGVSVEQLELDMLADNNCNRNYSSSPQSQSQSPFDYSNSFHHYSHSTSSTTASAVPSSESSSVRRSIESTSSHLSNLPAPSVISYPCLNVFPRPSFVPDPLDPSRNLVTDCHDSSSSASHQLQIADHSYLNPLIMSSSTPVPSTSAPTSSLMQQQQQPSSESGSIVTLKEQHLNSSDGDTNNANYHLPTGIHQNNNSQNAMKVTKPNDFANYNNGGNAPEDEEDEQNAIAISHLFPQFDALQQLKLIKMCTDSKVQEADDQDVVNMLLSPESDSSNKVARTLALIKGKVKEFKQINRMHYTNDTEGCSMWNDDNGVTKLVRIDEDIDIDVSGNDALQVHLNGSSSNVDERCVNGRKPSNDASSNIFEPVEVPVTTSSSNAYPTTSHTVNNNGTDDCIVNMGIAGIGCDIQPRMFSILHDPLSLTHFDEHPVHRTPAVILTEVPIHEDDDNIYVSEMKVVTDWFNHAPYGAGKEAHMRYWDDVKQRVDIADWIRKLSTQRHNYLLSILSRKQARKSRGDVIPKRKRRSKSTESWWPRKLFDHYEGVLDIAGKAMRTVGSSFASNTCSQDEIPRINNIPMKVIRLDGDEAAAVAYFRPGSPATVCDPNDDYQNDVIARELRHTTTIDTDAFNQIELGDDGSKANYLRWKKVVRMSDMKKSTKVANDSSRYSIGNSSSDKLKRCNSNGFSGVRLACEASLADVRSSSAECCDNKKDDSDKTSNFDYNHELLMDAKHSTTNHHHSKPSSLCSNISTSEFRYNTIESGYCSSAISSNPLPPSSVNSNNRQIPSTLDSFFPQPEHVLLINQSIADITNENGNRNGMLQLPPLSTVFDASSSDQQPLSQSLKSSTHQHSHLQTPNRYEPQLQSQSVDVPVSNLCSSTAPKPIDMGNYNHQSTPNSSSTINAEVLHLHPEANGSLDLNYLPFEHIINQANFKVHSLSKTTLDDRAEANFFDTLFEEDETKMADAGGDPFLRMDHLI